MKLSIRLSSLLKDQLHRRGLIQEIATHTGLERHTVAALLKNSAQYVSINALNKICTYLDQQKIVDADLLPGALWGKEHSGFWDMLANMKRLEFCLGTRAHPDWPGIDYVMANDAHLQGVLLSQVSARCFPDRCRRIRAKRHAQRHFPDPHLVPAAKRVEGDDGTGRANNELGQNRAREIHTSFKQCADSGALVALGSCKVCSVLDMILAETWGGEPFQSDDSVLSPKDRRCPFYFRYRPTDPTPDSLCGGTRLSQEHAPEKPGIYYEKEGGKWDCLPCVFNQQDAAFVFYAYRPHLDELQLACGGFSGKATGCLAAQLGKIADDLWAPQYRSPELEVGLFLVKIKFTDAGSGDVETSGSQDFTQSVIAIHPSVVQRRLGKPAPEDETAGQPPARKRRTKRS